MPVLNELLQQAAARSTTLAEEAQAALEAVTALEQRASDLGELLAQEAEEAHSRSQDLEARLEAAQGELQGAGQHAQAGLGGLAAAAARVEGRVGELTGEVKSAIAELEARREELTTAFDQEAQAAGASFAELAQRWQEVAESAGARLDEASQGVEALQEAILAARSELADRGGDLLALVESIDGAVREQAQLAGEAMARALEAQADAVLALEDRLKEAHNTAVVPLRQTFTEEAAERLDGSLAPLREALESVGSLCGEYDEGLQREVAELIERCDGIGGSLERSRDHLRSTDRLA